MDIKSKFKHYFTIIIIITLLVTILTGCTNHSKTESVSKTGYSLNTIIQISIYELDPSLKLSVKETSDRKATLASGAINLCLEYEQKFSRTINDSEIWNLNHGNGDWISLSPDTMELLSKAVTYCEMTDGKVDFTIAPVKELWDFTGQSPIPSESAINNALTFVDYTQLELDANHLKARLKSAEASIDLGFIAKGFIADKLKEYLIDHGVTSGLINLGGNVVTIGSKPDHTAFRVGIQKPFAEYGDMIAYADTIDGSVVTSGIYERSFTYNEKLYHHILDTNTGYPVSTDLLSATILSDSSAVGDALSTTCIVLGLNNSIDLIDSLDGIEAIFITSDYDIHYTYESLK